MQARRNVRMVLIPALAVLVALTLAGCGSPAEGGNAPPADIVFTIERGSLARQMRGEAVELLPPEIGLIAGQSIVIHNQDQALHYFLSTPVWPGDTLTKTFEEPGIYRYSGAFTCSLGSSNALTIEVAARNAADG